MPHKTLVSQQLADMFNVLSHPLRVRIIMELRHGELCVNSLQKRLGVRQSSVSQHLAQLKSQNLIKERRNGRFVLYRLSSPELASWIVKAIPLIVPNHEESTIMKVAARRVFAQWSLSIAADSGDSAS
jgi:ArsR family transcriptional regulator